MRVGGIKIVERMPGLLLQENKCSQLGLMIRPVEIEQRRRRDLF